MKSSQIKISRTIVCVAILFLGTSITSTSQLKAQEPNIDSLRTFLASNPKDDTNKVYALNMISRKLIYENKLDSALTIINHSLELSKKINYKRGMGSAYYSLGMIYNNKYNYPKSLTNYFLAVKIKEELGDKLGIAWTYNQISGIYENMQNTSEALKYGLKSLKLMNEFGDKRGAVYSYGIIGSCYSVQGKSKEALYHLNMSLKTSKELKDLYGVATAYTNIGDVYYNQSNYNESLKYQDSALQIAVPNNDEFVITLCYLNIGLCNKNLNNLKKAEEFLLKGLNLSEKISDIRLIGNSKKALSDLYAQMGDSKNAFEYYKGYIAIRDSLSNSDNTKKTTELEMNYQFDKKEAVVKIEQEKKDEIQKTKLYSAIFVVILALTVMIVIFRGYKRKQKDNILLTEQKEELNEKNRIIEEKQDEILASIRYAKHIQVSLMPTEKYIEKSLSRLKQ